MLERDENGYMIGDFPEGTKPVEGKELLVKVSEDALPEYSKEAFNAVVDFFRNLGLDVGVDNINIHEWMKEMYSMYKHPFIDCCRFAYTDENEHLFMSISIQSPYDEPERVMNDLMNETLLSVYVKAPKSSLAEPAIMHYALPYCIVEKIYKNSKRGERK